MDFDYASVGAGYYDAIFDKRGGVRRFWHLYKFERIEAAARTDERSMVLDVGCAAGTFLGRYSKPFQKAVGVDVSELQVEFARKKYGNEKISFRAGDVRSLELDGGPFNVIVASELIEHLSYADSLEMLRKLRARLEPRGRLVITTPNYRSLWPLLEILVNCLLPVSYEHQHINKLNAGQFQTLLERAGFKVERIESFFVAGQFLSVFSDRLARLVCDLERQLCPRFGALLIATATRQP